MEGIVMVVVGKSQIIAVLRSGFENVSDYSPLTVAL